MSTTRRDFIKTTAAATALSGLNIHGEQADNKPNLLFVFTDQQSFDMLGCYGNEQIQTPNLDRLAKESVRFEYCIASTPVCTPMRGMLLSGQHPLKNGAFSNDVCMLPGKGKYFGEVLRDNGYRTGYIGKWHLYGGERNRGIPAGPYRYGFDDVFLSNNTQLNFDPDVPFITTSTPASG
ncbi:MAG: sulfatase-like hydrolase/transferase [Planctomycetota bacterium]|jgi:arylsulfatase A-like enzyme|nr:sulfatase-like hydrolase/transferase [Planctomycetota bacterium]